MVVATSTLIVAGLALAAVGTGVTVVASLQQAKAQKKAAKESQKLAALEAARARRRTIREARIARGAALNRGAGQEAFGSGFNSLPARVGSQAGANLGHSTGTEAIGKRITKFGLQASKAASLGAIGGGIASLGGALFSNAGALSGIGGGSDLAPTFAPLPVPRPS